MYSSRFFIYDWLLECWHDLIGKDIEVTPVEACTTNGPVKEFHFIFVKYTVEEVDWELCGKDSRWVPKGDNTFMEGCQIAADKETNLLLYLTPELRVKTLAKKEKLKGVIVETFKEQWKRTY